MDDNDPFENVTSKIKEAGQLPMLLTAARLGLELAEATTRTLLEDDPRDDAFPGYLTARTEAVEARDALSRAPSLPQHPTQKPTVDTAAKDVAESVASLALVLAQALVAAAERSSNPADKVACLDAALHVGRLHEALR